MFQMRNHKYIGKQHIHTMICMQEKINLEIWLQGDKHLELVALQVPLNLHKDRASGKMITNPQLNQACTSSLYNQL